MGASDGTIIGAATVVNNGSRNSRWNLVIISEGYQNLELPQFAQDVLTFRTYLFNTEPFAELKKAINIFRIDVASNDSGAQSGTDTPGECDGGTGPVRNTYFDATFCSHGLQRLLTVNNSLVRQVIDERLPEAHAVAVLVNSNIEGGSGGGNFAVISKGGYFFNWPARLVHELGHTPFGLADEYDFWEGCGKDTDRDVYPHNEPSEPNVTKDRRGMKWRNFRTTTNLPTTSNADCSLCDPQPNPMPAGTVGTFEGARYYHCGVYRPEFNCKMRNSNEEFCAVCRYRIWETLAKHMPDQYLGNSNTREVHRITSRNRNCQFPEIKRSHLVYLNSLMQAHAAGYDNCHWCIGDSTR